MESSIAVLVSSSKLSPVLYEVLHYRHLVSIGGVMEERGEFPVGFRESESLDCFLEGLQVSSCGMLVRWVWEEVTGAVFQDTKAGLLATASFG